MTDSLPPPHFFRNCRTQLQRLCECGSELNQVWTNLIDNVIDAMNGQGKLEIRTQREHKDVLVEIADNGPGSPPAIESRIGSFFHHQRCWEWHRIVLISLVALL